jgi:hypothetical protein
MANQQRAIVIFNTKGEAGAYLLYPYLFNTYGEWIGWVTPSRDVYSLLGVYVGYLTRDPRILRKRNMDETHPRQKVIEPPAKFSPPATAPLAPLMSELTYDTVDVLLEFPDDLHTGDAGDLREDLD